MKQRNGFVFKSLLGITAMLISVSLIQSQVAFAAETEPADNAEVIVTEDAEDVSDGQQDITVPDQEEKVTEVADIGDSAEEEQDISTEPDPEVDEPAEGEITEPVITEQPAAPEKVVVVDDEEETPIIQDVPAKAETDNVTPPKIVVDDDETIDDIPAVEKVEAAKPGKISADEEKELYDDVPAEEEVDKAIMFVEPPQEQVIVPTEVAPAEAPAVEPEEKAEKEVQTAPQEPEEPVDLAENDAADDDTAEEPVADTDAPALIVDEEPVEVATIADEAVPLAIAPQQNKTNAGLWGVLGLITLLGGSFAGVMTFKKKADK